MFDCSVWEVVSHIGPLEATVQPTMQPRASSSLLGSVFVFRPGGGVQSCYKPHNSSSDTTVTGPRCSAVKSTLQLQIDMPPAKLPPSNSSAERR